MLAAADLQQEHVVGIEMRADGAAGRRIADHQVVQPGIRHEIETPQDVGNMRQVMVDVLHQDGPVAFRQAPQAAGAERAALQRPLALLELDQPRLDILAARQLGQPCQINRRPDIGQRAADQQRLLVPVVLQKGFGGHAAQQINRFHVRISLCHLAMVYNRGCRL
ncbi:hypothetical protein D3C72_1749930 [compost metagenome]